MDADNLILHRQRLLLGLPGTRLGALYGRQAIIVESEEGMRFEFVDDLADLEQHVFNRVFDRMNEASVQTTKQ